MILGLDGVWIVLSALVVVLREGKGLFWHDVWIMPWEAGLWEDLLIKALS